MFAFERREANFGGVPLAAIARTADDERPRYRLPIVRLDDLRRIRRKWPAGPTSGGPSRLEKIDYCSIDVEGAERAVLRSIDFDACDIAVLTIENNRVGGESESYQDIMGPAGYRQVGLSGMDEIWVKRPE